MEVTVFSPSFDLLERKSSYRLTLSKLRNVKMKLEKWQGVTSIYGLIYKTK
jgi:hypothetical protein